MLGSTSMMMRNQNLIDKSLEKKVSRNRIGSFSESTKMEVAFNMARSINTAQALSEMNTMNEKKTQTLVSCTCAIM
ncbi:unnamed protein product [Blepharisma stoltei]|uniref:Uncharacterized protein n=1 Tax=Blepharisma stoltei TaxID=1481888 RepID=A0AAU9JYZ4_9CILI|nr:unnamed protein product [Blepharisma stoltei]